MRYRRQPALAKLAWWRAKEVDIMDRIDEVIRIPKENDLYEEPHTFKEDDSDGRWELYTAEVHKRRQFPTARAARLQPSRSPRPIRRWGGPRLSSSTQGGPGNADDRNKENTRGPLVFSGTMNSCAIESDSSDDEDMENNAEADDAERQRISQLFEDFPTCIQKARNALEIDSNEYGIMAISNQWSGWSYIDPETLPPRIEKYLSGFTRSDAAAFPDSIFSDVATGEAGPHRWLLATARREFICDTLTLDVWYRPITNAQRRPPPQQPL